MTRIVDTPGHRIVEARLLDAGGSIDGALALDPDGPRLEDFVDYSDVAASSIIRDFAIADLDGDLVLFRVRLAGLVAAAFLLGVETERVRDE